MEGAEWRESVSVTVVEARSLRELAEEINQLCRAEGSYIQLPRVVYVERTEVVKEEFGVMKVEVKYRALVEVTTRWAT